MKKGYLTQRKLGGQLLPILMSFLGNSKYFVLWYNKKGKATHAENRDSHKFIPFLEKLTAHPIFENYHIPQVADLNRLFDTDIVDPSHIILHSGPVRKIAQKVTGSDKFLSFQSINRFEHETELSTFIASPPLTFLILIRLSPNQFLSIVVLSELYYMLFPMAENVVMLTDHDNRITGYSRLFYEMLGLDNPRELIDQPQQVLFRGEPPGRSGIGVPETNRMRRLFGWKGGSSFKKHFQIHRKSKTRIRQKASGLVVDNRSSSDYAFLEFNRALPIDNGELSVEIKFTTRSRNIPGLVLRGTTLKGKNLENIGFPDTAGYNFTLNPLDNKLLVKRRGDPIRISRFPLRPQNKPSVLRYCKSGDSFTVSLDHDRLAEFTDTPAFLPASDNRLFIFLRPGEHLVLHSIQVKYKSGRKAGAFQPGDSSVTVQYKGSTFFFNVYSEPQVFNNKNYTLYRLENVTGLKKDIATLQREKNHLAQRIRQETEFVGQAPSILKIKENIPVVADSDLSVLIEGETGTGKEVLARSIHEASRRHEKPFVKIDCSAIPENLLESELFGHAKGAFTGALHDHKGRFEQAQGGTVFLDEIANLPMSTQAKLLNVLQDFKVQPIGSTQTVKLDIKLITASNILLSFYIRQGKFREDLFYRLNQFSFRLPSLGERPEDVPLLAGHFLKEANALYEKNIAGFSSAALTKIFNTSWPGNIRQLRNAVLRAVLFCQEKMIQPKDIALEEAPGKVLSAALGKSIVRRKQGRLTKKGLITALKEENGKILRVAKRFGVCRLTVYRKLREFRINIDGYRKST